MIDIRPNILVSTSDLVLLSWNVPFLNCDPIYCRILDYSVQMRTENSQEWNNVTDKILGASPIEIIHGLLQSELYFFRVQALSTIGLSDWSVASNPVGIDAKAPSQPASPIVTALSSTHIDLAFFLPESNGAPIFLMQLVVRGVEFFRIFSITEGLNNGTLNYRISNLSPGGLYSITLEAENIIGFSQTSVPTSVQINGDRPSEPINFAICSSCLSSSNAKVDWVKPLRENGAPITSYIVQLGSSVSNSSNIMWIQSHQISSTSYTFTSLSPGTSYFARVNAFNTHGGSAYSTVLSFTTLAEIPIASAPIIDQPSVTSNRVRITWLPADQRGSLLEEYQIWSVIKEFDPLNPDDNQVESKDFTLSHRIPVFPGLALALTISNLNPGTTVFLKLAAKNGVGLSQLSSAVFVRTSSTAPGPPNLFISTITPYNVTVKWTPGAYNGEVVREFEIQRESVNGVWSIVSTIDFNTQEIEENNGKYEYLLGLQPGSSFRVRIRTHTNAGASLWTTSQQYRAPAIEPSSPIGLQAQLASTSIQLSWQEGENNGDAIIEYEVQARIDTNIEKLSWFSEGWFVFAVVNLSDPQTVIDNLVPNTTVSIRIRARNSIGWSSFSPIFRATTRPTVPSTPLLTLLWKTPRSFAVSWTRCQDNGAIVESVDLQLFRPPDSENRRGWVSQLPEDHPIGDNLPLNHTFIDMRPSTALELRVSCQNSIGQSPWSPILSFDLPADFPGTPEFLPFRTIETTQNITIMWQAAEPNGSPITHYQLNVSIDGGNTWQKDTIITRRDLYNATLGHDHKDDDSHHDHHHCKDFNVFDPPPVDTIEHQECNHKPGTQVFFRVRAQNSVGWSNWSQVLETQTRSARPLSPTLYVSQLNSTFVDIGWKISSSHGSPMRSFIIAISSDESLWQEIRIPLDSDQLQGIYTEEFIPGQTKYFRAKVANGIGESEHWSTILNVAALPSVPGPPRNIQVNQGSLSEGNRRSLTVRI